MTGPSQALVPDRCRCPRATPPAGTERHVEGLFGISAWYTQNKVSVCAFLPVCVEWLCLYVSRLQAKTKSSTGTLAKDKLSSMYLFWNALHLQRLTIRHIYDSLQLSFIFSTRETNHNSVLIAIFVQTLMLLCTTCLCRLSLSISERTHPTLPSPPHTRIRKLSNFWNRRRLENTTQPLIHLFCRVRFQLKPNNKM